MVAYVAGRLGCSLCVIFLVRRTGLGGRGGPARER